MKTWVVCLQVLSYEELSFMNNVKVRRATGKEYLKLLTFYPFSNVAAGVL